MAVYKANSVGISQLLMQNLFKLSNGNVQLQMQAQPHISGEPATEKARFICEVCGEVKFVTIDCVVNDSSLLNEMLWCKDHRHETKITVTEDSSAPTLNGERKLKVVL